MRKISLALIPAALFATAIGAQTSTSQNVHEKLVAAGYTEVRDVEFDDGLWEAEVRRADGRWDDVAFDEATGEVFDPADGRALLDAAGITQALTAAGFSEIRDLDQDDAIWDVEARDAQGRNVDLRVSGVDGRVLYTEIDDN